MTSSYDPTNYINKHLARQEACEGQRDEELDTILYEIKSDLRWASDRVEDMLELKPVDEEQVHPKDLFTLYFEMKKTLTTLRRACEAGGCEIIPEYGWQRAAGFKNDFE